MTQFRKKTLDPYLLGHFTYTCTYIFNIERIRVILRWIKKSSGNEAWYVFQVEIIVSMMYTCMCPSSVGKPEHKISSCLFCSLSPTLRQKRKKYRHKLCTGGKRQPTSRTLKIFDHGHHVQGITSSPLHFAFGK